MNTIISAKDLCCKIGKQYLLNNINWEIKQGEHWAVFGLNGSGKTTLFTIIAGFRSPSSGMLKILGKEYTQETVFDLRKQVGLVSSSFFDKCYKHESALHIVLSALTGTFNVDNSIRDVDVRKAKYLLRALKMGDKMYRPFYNMSKGERQNVLIARALITSPKILVLDEPCTGLDIYAREYVLQTVKSLAELDSITTLYVTHYPEEIQSFMNKTLLLKNGRIFLQGDTQTVLTQRNVSELLEKPVVFNNNEDGTIHIHVHVEPEIESICFRKQAK